MTHKLHDAARLVAFALALAGCSSDDEKTGGSGGTSGSGGSAGSGASGATVTITGTVSDFAPQAQPTDGGAPPPLPPVEGVEVCVLDQPGVPCATTDAQGTYTLPGVPWNVAEGGLTYVKSGYVSTTVLGSTGTEDLIYNTNIPSDSLASGFASIVGITWPDPGNGVVPFTVFTSLPGGGGMAVAPLDGATVSISPASGEGPFYTTDVQVPDKTLTTTSKSSLGFFTGLPPGDYDLTFTHPTKKSCQRTAGWQSSKQNSVKVRTLANFLVSAAMRCD